MKWPAGAQGKMRLLVATSYLVVAYLDYDIRDYGRFATGLRHYLWIVFAGLSLYWFFLAFTGKETDPPA